MTTSLIQDKWNLIYKGNKVAEIEHPGNHFVKSFKFKKSGKGWHDIYFKYDTADIKEKQLILTPFRIVFIKWIRDEIDKYGIKPVYEKLDEKLEDLGKLTEGKELKW